MLRRMGLALVVLAVLLSGRIVSATPLQVPDTEWSDSRSIGGTPAGLTGTLASGFTITWVISVSSDPVPVYSYQYTTSVAVDRFFLEVSPLATPLDGTFANIVPSAAVANQGSDYGFNFTKTGGVSQVSFKSTRDPIWGDVYVTAGSLYAENTKFGVDPVHGYDKILWVPRPDTEEGAVGTLVPEPSLSVLALLGLVTGGFARWRRKKEAEA